MQGSCGGFLFEVKKRWSRRRAFIFVYRGSFVKALVIYVWHQ